MKKFTQLDSNLPTNSKVGQNNSLKNSWFEIDENNGQFICGRGNEFTNAAISIRPG